MTPEVRIVPFRGEYYMLRAERRSIVRGLIYPVPDPEFPFLGVHFTRTIHGDVEAGPNAVLAFAREGYTLGTVRPADLAGTLGYARFWHMARKYWRVGAYEMYRSASKAAFVRSLQKLVPDIQAGDLEPGGAGVRAQAVAPDGTLVDDFKISVTAGRGARGQCAVARRDRLARHRPARRRCRRRDVRAADPGRPAALLLRPAGPPPRAADPPRASIIVASRGSARSRARGSPARGARAGWRG